MENPQPLFNPGVRSRIVLVGVVDEHDIFRRGIVACLGSDAGLQVVYEARTGPVPVPVDVTVASARTVTRLIGPGPVLVCSDGRTPEDRFGSVRVIAVLPRDRLTEDQIVAAVRAAASGLRVGVAPAEPPAAPGNLPERSIEILRLLAEGCSTHEISAAIGYSERTIKSAIQAVERRLGARGRAHAVAEAIRLGLI